MTTLGELAASIAHEINQPLAAIVADANACLHWLDAAPPPLDQGARGPRRGRERRQPRGGGTRPDSRHAGAHGGRPGSRAKLAAVIGPRAAPRASRARPSRHRPLQTSLATDLPPVLGDRIQLQQVLLNLLVNAAEALCATFRPSDAGSFVRVGPRRTSSDGPRGGRHRRGRSASASASPRQIHLFDPFFTTKPHGLGNGPGRSAGLSSRGMGAVSGRRPTPTHGATFHIALPRDAMSSESPVVVVVDDDRAFRDALGRLLTSVGLSVEAFPSARAFLSSPRRHAPGCLVLDVRLPGLSGLDLQQELANTDTTLPIIFLTGHGDIPMSVRAVKAGAHARTAGSELPPTITWPTPCAWESFCCRMLEAASYIRPRPSVSEVSATIMIGASAGLTVR